MPSQIVLDKYVEFLANNPRVDSQKLRDIIRSVGLHYGLSGNRNIVRVFANLVLDESLDELTRWFAYTYMHEVYATPTDALPGLLGERSIQDAVNWSLVRRLSNLDEVE